MLKKETLLLMVSVLAGVSACERPASAPPAFLYGTWKTTAPGYTENYLRISPTGLAFGVDGDVPHDRLIKSVRHKKDTAGELYTITYVEADQSEFQLVFYHETNSGESLVFKHQAQLRWTRQGGAS